MMLICDEVLPGPVPPPLGPEPGTLRVKVVLVPPKVNVMVQTLLVHVAPPAGTVTVVCAYPSAPVVIFGVLMIKPKFGPTRNVPAVSYTGRPVVPSARAIIGIDVPPGFTVWLLLYWRNEAAVPCTGILTNCMLPVGNGAGDPLVTLTVSVEILMRSRY